MPTPTNYTYSIPLDCPGGAINPSKLQTAIRASSIVVAMSQISTYGGNAVNGQISGAGTITIYFNDVLSTADRTTLMEIMEVGELTAPLQGLIQLVV